MSDGVDFDRPAYLGLDRDGEWLRLIREGMELYGAHYAGSRLAPYCPPVFDELEVALARRLGAEEVVTVSSGTLAARTVLEVLRQQGYRMFVGPLAHAAWRRGSGVEVFEDDADWRLAVELSAQPGQRCAVITDRMHAIDCIAADLDWLQHLPEGVLVVVDDSHAIGVLDGGRGTCGALESRGSDVLVVASLGKAYSMPGAVIAGSSALLGHVRETATYGGASPLPPAYAYALLEGGLLTAQRRRRLAKKVQQVEALACELGHVSGHPVFGLTTEAQAQALRQAGVVYSALRYPDAGAEEVRRVVLRADSEVDKLVSAIR